MVMMGMRSWTIWLEKQRDTHKENWNNIYEHTRAIKNVQSIFLFSLFKFARAHRPDHHRKKKKKLLLRSGSSSFFRTSNFLFTQGVYPCFYTRFLLLSFFN